MIVRHFYVWCPEYGHSEADATAITTHGPREAATEWAAHDDVSSADYSIVKGRDVTVLVRDKDNRELSEWIVSGEVIPHYSARPKPPEQDQPRPHFNPNEGFGPI